jgi:8-oxo-dGTP pyrophosphatase MutT (NUDIX family)
MLKKNPLISSYLKEFDANPVVGQVMRASQKNSFQNKTCTNCGAYGHSFRQCIAPVTSHGAILFRVLGSWNPAKVLAENESALTGFEGSGELQFLLIQRRDSLGFVEMMRGKYNISDYTYITTQMRGMTKQERERFLHLPFTELWNTLWGVDHSNVQYKNEKENSRQKLEQLREEGLVDDHGVHKTLAEVFDTMGPGWDTPEWGFPKGRRDPNESERECALRELYEETGIRREHVQVIENCEPVQETFFGSNHIHYCHKYIIGCVSQTLDVKYDPSNEHMKREIGSIGWFTLEQALEKIRPENVEKKEILLLVRSFLRNYCPLNLIMA